MRVDCLSVESIHIYLWRKNGEKIEGCTCMCEQGQNEIMLAVSLSNIGYHAWSLIGNEYLDFGTAALRQRRGSFLAFGCCVRKNVTRLFQPPNHWYCFTGLFYFITAAFPKHWSTTSGGKLKYFFKKKQPVRNVMVSSQLPNSSAVSTNTPWN